ncbi:MAG: type II toxin-antitoxin system HicB family antitoxin [Chloroflexota bacterium]
MQTNKTKTLAYYMALPYPIEVTPPEDDDEDWFAEIPLLHGCMAQGTKDEIINLVEETKRIWIETALEYNDSIPEPSLP